MVRKTIIYVVAWFAAGVGAVALATAGVSMVGNQVTDSRPSPLSADEVRSQLAADSAAEATRTESPTTSLPAGAVTTTTPTTDGPTATTASSRPTGSGPPTTATPTTTTQPAPVTRTYMLIGGTATLRFTASGVTVVDATPNGGYSVVVEPTHDTGIRVEFRSDEHRSRVEGWWDGGPRDETSEEG